MSRSRVSTAVALAAGLLVAGVLAACSSSPPRRVARVVASAAAPYIDPRGDGRVDQVAVPTPAGGVSFNAHYDPTRHSAPWILYVHGGYWRAGDAQIPYWAERHRVAGYQVFSVTYRLSQVAKWPGPLDDVKAVITYLRAHARHFGLDPVRGALVGFSAGGQLATIAALETHVAGVVDIDGAVDPLTALTAPDRSLQSAAIQLLGCLPVDCPGHWQDARTVTHIDGQSPPMLVVHSVGDPAVPFTQAVELVDALRRAGRPVEFIPVPGAVHSSGSLPAVSSRVDAFLKQVTAHRVG